MRRTRFASGTGVFFRAKPNGNMRQRAGASSANIRGAQRPQETQWAINTRFMEAETPAVTDGRVAVTTRRAAARPRVTPQTLRRSGPRHWEPDSGVILTWLEACLSGPWTSTIVT